MLGHMTKTVRVDVPIETFSSDRTEAEMFYATDIETTAK